MEIRDAAYYDLIGRSLLGITYQEFVDTMFADKYNAPSLEGFIWDDAIQMDFTYHQVEAELGIYAMATYVDIDSPAPMRGMSGIQVQTGKIPRMKHGFNLNEAQIREQMLLAGQGVFTSATENAMMKLLYKSTDQLIGGNYNSLSYQRNQLVSTGKFETTSANNPMGLQNLSFDYKIPSGNITTLAGNYRWWTDTNYTTEGSTAAPVEDLVALVRRATDVFAPVSILEVSKVGFNRFLGHSKAKISLGYLYSPDAVSDSVATNTANRLSIDEARGLLERKLGITIRIVDHIAEVEKYNKATKTLDYTRLSSFDEDAWVLIPSGELGTIKAVAPIIIADPAARIATFDEGRTVITQTFDARNKVQTIESELTAICVPTKRKYMFYLNIK